MLILVTSQTALILVRNASTAVFLPVIPELYSFASNGGALAILEYSYHYNWHYNRERVTKRWRELHFERGCQARLGRRVNPQAWMQLTEEGLTGCDKARGQRHAVNNNVGSRFLTQKRAE